MTKTLGDELPRKMKEIREVYIPAYQSIGPSGAFAIHFMNEALTKAEGALATQDIALMIEALNDLNDFKL